MSTEYTITTTDGRAARHLMDVIEAIENNKFSIDKHYSTINYLLLLLSSTLYDDKTRLPRISIEDANHIIYRLNLLKEQMERLAAKLSSKQQS